jgi:hypothetical protein
VCQQIPNSELYRQYFVCDLKKDLEKLGNPKTKGVTGELDAKEMITTHDMTWSLEKLKTGVKEEDGRDKSK